MTFRQGLIERLLDSPAPLTELARELEITPRQMADELKHLERSLVHQPYRLVIHPARCRKCGFEFDANRFRKPGKCPHCRNTWIAEPAFEIRRASA